MYMCFELYTPDWKVSKNHNLCDLVSQKLQHMRTFVVKIGRGGKGVGGFLTIFLWIYTMSTDIFYCHLVFDFSKMNDSSFAHQIFRCIFFKKLCEFIFGGRFSDYQEEIHPSVLLRGNYFKLKVPDSRQGYSNSVEGDLKIWTQPRGYLADIPAFNIATPAWLCFKRGDEENPDHWSQSLET